MAPSRVVDPSSERGRIRAALLDLVAERGYSSTTLVDLLDRAAVDRSTFERHFADLEDCFAAVWDEVDVELDRRVFAALSAPGPWRDRARAALDAGLRFLAEDDARARLYVSEAVFVGSVMQARRQAAMQRMIAVIDLGREDAISPERVSPAVAEAIAGALWHRANSLIRSGQSAALPAALPALLYMLFLPYLGPEVAAEELRRPSG